MKEIKDVEPSVLVLILTESGEEKVAVEAFRGGALALRRKDQRARKNYIPAPRSQSAAALGRHHKIRQAVRFINDNYRTDIRLDAVAAEAGMSSSHFSRTFKKVMGLPYQEYLNRRRITKAKELLRASPRSITEIAVSLGFSDPTGFGRIFKKLTGQTPSAYRRQSDHDFFTKKA